jgi:hypothetical protein
MKELEGLEAVFLDEFKKCGPMINSFFDGLYEELSEKLASRAIEHMSTSIDSEDMAYIIDGAFWDHHWQFNSVMNKADANGMTTRQYLARYFVKRIRQHIQEESEND